MGKNQNTWSHRTKNHIPWNKNHIPPPRKPHRFSHQSYCSLTGKRQRHSERITCRRPLQFVVDVVFKCLRQHSNGQQYFTCMCFIGFSRYNKTFIGGRFRKYENLFTHEYHIPLECCPQGIWYSWVNKFSYFPHQHAIKV